MSFLSLSFAASGVISILYAFIEKFVPDVSSLSSLSYYNYMDSFIVKYGISSIFIAGTVYIIVMWYINKLIFKGSVPESSKVRKWLTYIVLFIAAASVLGDLASLLYNFLDGDMALKFFLKFLVRLPYIYFSRNLKPATTICSAQRRGWPLPFCASLLSFSWRSPCFQGHP